MENKRNIRLDLVPLPDDNDAEKIRKYLIALNLRMVELLTDKMEHGRIEKPENERIRIEICKGIATTTNTIQRLLKTEESVELQKRLQELEKKAARVTVKVPERKKNHAK